MSTPSRRSRSFAKAASRRAPPTDPRLSRIFDANLNRAREGIRVAEEVARFYIADGALAEHLKSLRETIGGWERALGLEAGVGGRDCETDPGRRVTGPREASRDGVGDLVRANMKRAQEAVRVIEELSKLDSSPRVSEFKDMRYTLYSAEAELLAALARDAGR